MKSCLLHYIVLGICGIILCCCSQPVDSFERTNELDPQSKGYKPNGPDTVLVSFFSEQILEIKWFDRSYTQQRYLVERKINDSEFSVIEEFDVARPADSTVILDTASMHGVYTYRVTGFYPEQSIQSFPSKPLIVKNWLKVASKKYKGGDLVVLNEEKILAHTGSGGEIYSSNSLNWEEIDLSICENKASVSKKLHDGNVSVICTSDELNESELGVFVFDTNESKWILAGKLNSKIEDLHNRRSQFDIIPINDGTILVLGLSRGNNGIRILAELFDFQTRTSKLVSPELDSLNVRVKFHDSAPYPTGIELPNKKVLINTSVRKNSGDNKLLIFDPSDYSWELISDPIPSNEISDMKILKDGRVITIDGTNSGFRGRIYNLQTNGWTEVFHYTYSGFAKKLVKISNGNVFSIDSGGNVYLFETEVDSWRRLENDTEPEFNFQYNSASVYQGNVIMVNNWHSNSTYMYRPSPGEKQFFE